MELLNLNTIVQGKICQKIDLTNVTHAKMYGKMLCKVITQNGEDFDTRLSLMIAVNVKYGDRLLMREYFHENPDKNGEFYVNINTEFDLIQPVSEDILTIDVDDVIIFLPDLHNYITKVHIIKSKVQIDILLNSFN